MSNSAIKIENKEKPFIVSRKNIPTLTQVKENGKHFNLGQLKDFRKLESLKDFMPLNCNTSFSWVSLKPNEELCVHEHPIESMIIITRGQGELTGETSGAITEGDIICVPPFTRHGFIGRGEAGFWGLSIQFQNQGLYEDPDNALVKFDKQAIFHDKILCAQAQWKKKIGAHPLFPFVKELEDRTAFLTVFRYWSDAFQELVLLRQVLVSNPKFYPVTAAHLAEEFGHNEAFAHLPPFPPSLKMQSIYSWFTQKVLKMDDQHRVIFMHLAIEGSASVFYHHLHSLFRHADESEHFDQHNDLDHIHEGMGFDLIHIHNVDEFNSLLTTLNETWGMIDELYTGLLEECQRFLRLSISH